MSPQTLPATLEQTVRQFPDKGIRHLDSTGAEQFQSYAELRDEAERVLAALQQQGLGPQDKVIFQLDRSQDFLVAFWACILGGVVPIPLSIAPTYDHPNGALTKLQNVWQLFDQPPIIAGDSLYGSLTRLTEEWGGTASGVLNAQTLRQNAPATAWHESKPDDLALLLLTSGSTGMPKAVMLTHANMLARSAGTAQLNHLTKDDISLNWFPLDHVGGIVMFHVRDVFLGSEQIHAPIQTVLEDPLLWLDWVDRYRVSVSWAPNFAYGLVSDRIEALASDTLEHRDKQHWDLRSWRFILNAGEAIVSKSVRRFLAVLEPYGLPCTAMHPAWGMSETSSAFTYSDRFTRATSSDDDSFVAVGVPIPGGEVRIVDANDQCVPEGAIGRLQVRGPQITRGYYQNPDANAASFTADGWFKTGDLGRLQDGQLTITGREKDVIIINGVNYHSHEIESVVEEIEGIEPSFVAACAVRPVGSDTDKLAVFFSAVSPDLHTQMALSREVRRQILAKIGLNVNILIPVGREDIPKTAIGKIQRTQLRQRLEAGEFSAILKQMAELHSDSNAADYVAPRSSGEAEVAAIWQEVLALPRIGVLDNFFELGGDSLLATQIISRLRAAFAVDITLHHLFEGPTVAQIATAVETLQIEQGDIDDVAALLAEIESLSDEKAAALLLK